MRTAPPAACAVPFCMLCASSSSLTRETFIVLGRAPAAGGNPQRFRQTPGVVKGALGPSQHVETVASSSGGQPLQCDVLQYLIASGLAFVGEPFRRAFQCLKNRRFGYRLGVFCRVE